MDITFGGPGRFKESQGMHAMAQKHTPTDRQMDIANIDNLVKMGYKFVINRTHRY